MLVHNEGDSVQVYSAKAVGDSVQVFSPPGKAEQVPVVDGSFQVEIPGNSHLAIVIDGS